jgi:hypothetical protein
LFCPSIKFNLAAGPEFGELSEISLTEKKYLNLNINSDN